MYSASEDEHETVTCFLVFHTNERESNKNVKSSSVYVELEAKLQSLKFQVKMFR